MSTGALIMMVTCYTVIISMASYFFYRVLTTKPKADNPVNEDSFNENDGRTKLPKDDFSEK